MVDCVRGHCFLTFSVSAKLSSALPSVRRFRETKTQKDTRSFDRRQSVNSLNDSHMSDLEFTPPLSLCLLSSCNI